MKNQKILAFSLCLILVLGLSFAIAAGERTGKDNSTNGNKSLNILKRSNYGQCVSGQTKIRNSCYNSERQTYKTCNANIRGQYKNQTLTNRTQIKDMNMACKNTYKEKMNQCRLNFQSNKATCEKQKPHVLTQENCTAGGGRWNECSSKCAIINQGKQNVSCTTVCDTLCECGTIAGLTCPEGYTCIAPKNVADAMGYCR